jgi:hypothetical protein
MSDLSYYQKRREALKRNYLSSGEGEPRPLQTGGVDHLALICSELERTIAFYAEVLGMRLAQIVRNRDEPTSVHIFLDMDGANQLAFIDFPESGAGRTVQIRAIMASSTNITFHTLCSEHRTQAQSTSAIPMKSW